MSQNLTLDQNHVRVSLQTQQGDKIDFQNGTLPAGKTVEDFINLYYAVSGRSETDHNIAASYREVARETDSSVFGNVDMSKLRKGFVTGNFSDGTGFSLAYASDFGDKTIVGKDDGIGQWFSESSLDDNFSENGRIGYTSGNNY